MGRYIAVHPDFELVWPDVPEYLREYWGGANADVEYVRLDEDDRRPLREVLDEPEAVEQLVALGVPVTDACLDALMNLREATVMNSGYAPDEAVHEALAQRGVETHFHDSEGFWSESVAELGVALTIGAMRRVPQKHHAMTRSHDPWDMSRTEAGADRGYPGFQGTGDTPFWTHGTLRDVTVRGVGVGNIGSRYLDYLGTMGADVTAYDPYADEPGFHRIGADRVHSLADLVEGAEIFAPLVPLTDETEGLVGRDLIYGLPEGCLVVLITRAGVVDTEAVRERVLADELALAADVYDEEPLPLSDPLLGRENVVHTPHVAGRTPDANAAWARMLLARFEDSGVAGPD